MPTWPADDRAGRAFGPVADNPGARAAAQWPKDRPGTAATTAARHDVATTERGTWVRFAVAVLIGICALLLPAVAPRVGHTGAVFTDHEQVSTDLHIGPTTSPSTPATDDPAPDPDPAPDGPDAP